MLAPWFFRSPSGTSSGICTAKVPVFASIANNSSILNVLAFFTLSYPTGSDVARLVIWGARLLFVVNIISSLRQAIPLLAREDNMDDIPLTPSQRHLLGLRPSTKTTPAGSPLAPSTGYVTPPRYHRRLSGSASPAGSPAGSPNTAATADPSSADRRSISANYSASPLSTSRYTVGFSPSPSAPQTQPFNRTGRTASGSPFSPSGSPLFHKALDRQRRQSQDFDFGRSNGLGRSSSSVRDGAGERGSPLPRARKGVNFKWLYDQNYSFGNGPSRGLASSQSMNF